MNAATLASTWQGAAGAPITDELLDWPPDVFALANVILGDSEAFRFVLSPIDEWPPRRFPGWVDAVEEAAREWTAWCEHRRGAPPDLVVEVWGVVRDHADTPVEDLAEGRDGELSESLLTLHAVADEACAGLGVALDTSDAGACVYRARGRELLARTGSMARLDPGLLRVLPKVRTPPTGRPAFSRYACVQRPGISARWHKVPTRHRGTDLPSEYATLLLLPWPLRVRASDFRPIAQPVQRREKEPFGFFEFAPADGLDLELLDGVLDAARDEAGSVDVVCLPESAVGEEELGDLEGLLDAHGVAALWTGVREQSRQPGRFPGNWIHHGVNPALAKGTTPGSGDGDAGWIHIRQAKHHRWSLDDSQIYQYHLGGVLHPGIRWWEAMEVPRRAIQFVQVAELTLVALVCEDLAQNGHVAELIRSVGPTVVMTGLLDGPQLTSRWAARYATVLADDPGSAVLTLTSYGMVQRSRPRGLDASPVVALWKDPSRGVREIPLEAGAQAVLLTVCLRRATRRSADGRWPVDNGTECFDVAVHQIRADANTARPSLRPARAAPAPVLDGDDLTVLTGWAEAVAEALAHGPDRTAAVLADARPDAPWRTATGLPRPSSRLGEAIGSLSRFALANATSNGTPAFDAMLAAAGHDPEEEKPLDRMVRRALLSMLEERQLGNPRLRAHRVVQSQAAQLAS
jgi:hypothetical protein